DVEAVREGLADGTIDIVATDHAPHPRDAKDREWDRAAMGMTGLETALSLVQLTMVDPGRLSGRDVARVLSEKPAQIGRDTEQGRPLEPGSPAHVLVWDPRPVQVADPADHASLSRNSPFAELELPGTNRLTVLGGRPPVREGRVVRRGATGWSPSCCSPCCSSPPSPPWRGAGGGAAAPSSTCPSRPTGPSPTWGRGPPTAPWTPSTSTPCSPSSRSSGSSPTASASARTPGCASASPGPTGARASAPRRPPSPPRTPPRSPPARGWPGSSSAATACSSSAGASAPSPSTPDCASPSAPTTISCS